MTPSSHLKETPELGSPFVFRLDIENKNSLLHLHVAFISTLNYLEVT